MSRNGSGTYSLPAGNPVVTGTTISSTVHNATLADLAAEMTNSLAKDGQTVPTANIPMGGFKLTGLAAATLNGDAVRYEQIAQLTGANSSITSMTGLTAPTVAANPVRATDEQIQLVTAFTTGGSSTAFTLTPTPAITANAANQRFRVKFNAASGATPTLAVSGQTALNLKYYTSAGTKAAITSTQVPINWIADVENDGTDWVVLDVVPPVIATASTTAAVRQTVSGGPIDANGFPSFLPATSVNLNLTSQNVTSSAPLTVVSSNGFNNASGAPVDRFGFSTSNLTWTGLTANQTNYLYVDVAADGSLTTGQTILAPQYQWGGTRSTTNLQATYNIQEGWMTVGNGAAAVQTYRVFVGEAVAGAATITSTVAYAYNGIYKSATTATLPSAATRTNLAANIGTTLLKNVELYAVNTTTDNGYTAGMIIKPMSPNTQANNAMFIADRNTVAIQSGASGAGWQAVATTSGGNFILTSASWSYYVTAERAW